MEGNWTGRYWVRAGRWALQEARKWLPKKAKGCVLISATQVVQASQEGTK
jgi:hypothetical protein